MKERLAVFSRGAWLLSIVCLLFTPPAFSADLPTAETTEARRGITYQNPVLDGDFPDPAVLRAPDGVFYAYATQGPLGNVQVARSKDLATWEPLGDALPVKPRWASRTQNFWAPHVLAVGRKYVMFFSSDRNDHGDDKCIGVATARSPQGPFQAREAPLLCGPSFQNIDPMVFEDVKTGRAFLYWGSAFQPIRVRELAADRMHFAPGSRAQPLLMPSTAPYEALVEGAWVTERDGWYYLFYSGSDCCTLPDPAYSVMVARARSPLGPFEKLSSADAKRPHSAILLGNEQWRAPGHNAVVRDAQGTDWLVYHAADRDHFTDATGFIRRPMLMDRIEYENGWPLIAGGSPSRGPQRGPVIR